ncbi:S1/P1 nuclease [Roseateles sp. DB2]|uniref:S1/P1 nuclease n=1 Tax=Roseateles sp. DB2 TaxID=3453717 RepID=UPI003EEA0B77
MPYAPSLPTPARSALATAFAALALAASPHQSAMAWGATGHSAVGDIAAQLIKGTRAEREVARILGSVSLHDIAVWPDCVKGIDPAKDFRYTVTGRYPECAPFENKPEEEALMRDYVKRNNEACGPQPGDESCHKQYHYTNPALERGRYKAGSVGTSDHDIVAALDAARLRLAGSTVPGPFALQTEREALALLVHDLGDVHQPLHVGSVYLDEKGQRRDPDVQGDDPQARTIGGNALAVMGPNGPAGNLHAYWDNAPGKLNPEQLAALPAAARQVPAMASPPALWPAQWASETMNEAEAAYAGLRFGERQSSLRGSRWVVTLPADYEARSQVLVRQQLARAGARLAQLLQTIWPEAAKP